MQHGSWSCFLHFQVTDVVLKLYTLLSRKSECVVEAKNAVDIVTTDIIKKDVQLITDTAQEKIDSVKNGWLWWYEWDGFQVHQHAHQMLQWQDDNTSRTLDYFEACDRANESLVFLPEKEFPQTESPQSSVTLQVTPINNTQSNTNETMETTANSTEPSTNGMARKIAATLYPTTFTSDFTSTGTGANATGFNLTSEITTVVSMATENFTTEVSSSVPPTVCTVMESFNFTSTLWQKMKDLIFYVNDSQSLENAKNMLQEWDELPDFIKTYLGAVRLDEVINRKRTEPGSLNVNLTVEEIYQFVCNSTAETSTASLVTETPEVVSESAQFINCSTIFDETKKLYFVLPQYFQHMDQWLKNDGSYVHQLYLSRVNKVYENMTELLDDIPQHDKCLKAMDYLHNMTEKIRKINAMMMSLAESRNFSEALTVLRMLYTSYAKVKHTRDEFFKIASTVDSFDFCEWYIPVAREEDNRMGRLLTQFQTTLDYSVLATQFRRELQSGCQSIKSIFIDKVFPTFQQLEKYLSRSTTKKELANNFEKIVFTKALNDFVSGVSEMKAVSKELTNQVTALKSRVINTFQQFTEFTMPVLNYLNAEKLSFIKAIEMLDLEKYNILLESFDTDMKSAIGELLADSYDNFLDHPVTMSEDIVDEVDNLIDLFAPLQTELSAYRASAKMDVNFYM